MIDRTSWKTVGQLMFVLLALVILFGPLEVAFASPTAETHSASPNPDVAKQADPGALAAALGVPLKDLLDVRSSDQPGAAVINTPLGASFPTEGNSFVVLSTGKAENATNAYSLEKDRDTTPYLSDEGIEETTLGLTLTVPDGMHCASFDFAFYSEEYPHYVGEQFNDIFRVAVRGDMQSDNIAFDSNGNDVSVNAAFGIKETPGTAYNGGTPLLSAQTPVQPGMEIELVFNISDQGDSILDSAVFLDNFRWSENPDCEEGAKQVEETPTATPTSVPPTPTATPTSTPTPTPVSCDCDEPGTFRVVDNSVAEEFEDTTVYLIFDGSHSMIINKIDGQTRLEVAKDGMNDVIDALPNDIPVALRAYGVDGRENLLTDATWKQQKCYSQLLQDVAPLDKDALIQDIKGIEVLYDENVIDDNGYELRGHTPLRESLEAAYEDLKDRGGKKLIVLMTDGLETCWPVGYDAETDPEPKDVGIKPEQSNQDAAREFIEKLPASFDVSLNIVGIGFSDEDKKTLEALAAAGNGTASYVSSDGESCGAFAAGLGLSEFTVTNEAGNEVHTGMVNDPAVDLDPGQYTVKVCGGSTFALSVPVQCEKPTEIDLNPDAKP